MAKGMAQFNHGKGLPKRQPRRGVCPKCQKRGMGQPKVEVISRSFVRSCMYCTHVEVKKF
jgi:hypothetical protein